MKQVQDINDVSLQLRSSKFLKIANQAVKIAKEENARFGIPEYIYKNGKLYYVQSNGELTTQRPR